MTKQNLLFDVAQLVALLVLGVANGALAYLVYRIQKDRNTPKLVIYVELVEGDERDYYGLYVQNIGLVPALNVRVEVDVEEWRNGHAVKSKFHEEGYEMFEDSQVSLNPQQHRLYELPEIQGWALIIAARASCRNGPSDSICFALGDDRSAVRDVAFGKGQKRVLKRLGTKHSPRIFGSKEIRFTMGMNSLKDYVELFGGEAENP